MVTGAQRHGTGGTGLIVVTVGLAEKLASALVQPATHTISAWWQHSGPVAFPVRQPLFIHRPLVRRIQCTLLPETSHIHVRATRNPAARGLG